MICLQNDAMNRRKLLKQSLIIGTAGLVGGSGVWLMNGYDVNKLTIQQATIDLQSLYLLPMDQKKIS